MATVLDALAARGVRWTQAIALELSPRSFPAWWGLVKLAEKEGRPAEVRALLTEAVAAGTGSPSIFKKLAEIEGKAGDAAAAERHLAEARRLAEQ